MLSSYTAKKSHLCIPEKELRGLSPNFLIHMSVSDLYISRICPHIFLQQNRQTDPGMGIGTSLRDTWMWKLGLRPRNSFSGNTYFGFLCSVEWNHVFCCRLTWLQPSPGRTILSGNVCLEFSVLCLCSVWRVGALHVQFVCRCCRTWCTAPTCPTPPSRWASTSSGWTESWRSSSDRATRSGLSMEN